MMCSGVVLVVLLLKLKKATSLLQISTLIILILHIRLQIFRGMNNVDSLNMNITPLFSRASSYTSSCCRDDVWSISSLFAS